MRLKPPTEHAEQADLISWAQYRSATMQELKTLFAIPNGGARHTATGKKLKAEGVKRGVPDLFLPVPRGNYCGLFVELKRRSGGRLSPKQKEWCEFLRAHGYAAEVCRGWEHAAHVIENYLRGVG
jgi:hypothetical protein